jgi:hypothetical protein
MIILRSAVSRFRLAINNALPAVRILGASIPRLPEIMSEYMRSIEKEVLEKVAVLKHVSQERNKISLTSMKTDSHEKCSKNFMDPPWVQVCLDPWRLGTIDIALLRVRLGITLH